VLALLVAAPYHNARADEPDPQMQAVPQAQPDPQVQAPQAQMDPQAQAPQAQAAPVQGPQAIACVPTRVHFDTDSAKLSTESQAVLDQAADCIKRNQRLRVTIEGNTDQRGTQEYNMKLGQERADAVSQYLTSKGVSPSQLSTLSFGKDRLLCDTKDPECLAKNRRTAIRAACKL
jgi:peptidoglycan-associated lipoprotein